MSLIRCHKHDVTWDSDIAAECPRCEEVMLPSEWEHLPIRGNYVLHADGFFISYQPMTGGLVAKIAFFIGDTGGAETALVREQGGDYDYRILNGDWRKEYEALVPKGWDACLAFYTEMKAQHGSSWSDDLCEAAE